MKENILIIGGTGFIGQNLLNGLSQNKYSLFSLSKKKINNKKRLKNVNYIFCDITKFKDLKKKINYRFDHVVNLSGYVDHSKKKQNITCHYLGSKNLIDIFKNKKIKTFLQIGSSLEYGNAPSPQKEVSNCKPKGSYGLSKLKASKYLKLVGKINNFPFIILRPYQVYGPYQKKNRLIPQTINSCLKNKKFKCTLGKQLRDFIYIDDFIILIKKILKTNKPRQEIYNVGSGFPVSVKSVINKIHNFIKKGNPLYGKIVMRKDEIHSLYPSIQKVKKHFNWHPKYKISSGIKKTISFYRKN
jgi:nucleoside-diphosphate-sugar epimerase